MVSLWSWFKGTEEEDKDGLKSAIEQNRAAVKNVIITSRKSKSQAKELLDLAQNGLDILSKIEEKQK